MMRPRTRVKLGTNGEIPGHIDAQDDEDAYHRIKRELHRQVIAGIDLSVIGTMHEVELRKEVRKIAETLCRRRVDLLSLHERETLANEMLDEVFGLGPLEPLF